MNPSIGEEGGQTVRTLISTMKDSPMTLALVVFNLVFIAAVFWLSKSNRENLDHVIVTLLAQNDKTLSMLYNCTPNPGPPPTL